MTTWQWCSLDELTTSQWYAVMAAREAVFVVEQECAYQELDGWDLQATHLIGWRDDANRCQTTPLRQAHAPLEHYADQVAAYLRCFAPGVKYPEASLGRILTTKPFRNSGLGRELVERGLARIDELHPGAAVRIGAQSRLERFYASFGFVVASEPYMEDGIPHIEMLRPAQR